MLCMIRSQIKVALCYIAVSVFYCGLSFELRANTFEQGYQAYIKTDFSGARDKLTAAAKNENNPVKLTKIYRLLGIVYYMLSNLNESARTFNIALSYNPSITIGKGEVLDESVITYFNRIKSMRLSLTNQNNPSINKFPRKGKKRYRVIKRRRPFTTMENVYASLPFGTGQFMHEQYFYGVLSGALQISAISYFFYLNDQIQDSKSREQTALASSSDSNVNAIISAEERSYRNERKTYQQISIASFIGLWAISSLDAFLTPKYKKTRQRISNKNKTNNSLYQAANYTFNVDLAPQSIDNKWSFYLKFQTSF